MINGEKTTNPDGSFSTAITDSETNKVEIHMYDEQGNCTERVYGFISEEPELSDEDVDKYITELLKKQKSIHMKG